MDQYVVTRVGRLEKGSSSEISLPSFTFLMCFTAAWDNLIAFENSFFLLISAMTFWLPPRLFILFSIFSFNSLMASSNFSCCSTSPSSRAFANCIFICSFSKMKFVDTPPRFCLFSSSIFWTSSAVYRYSSAPVNFFEMMSQSSTEGRYFFAVFLTCSYHFPNSEFLNRSSSWSRMRLPTPTVALLSSLARANASSTRFDVSEIRNVFSWLPQRKINHFFVDFFAFVPSLYSYAFKLYVCVVPWYDPSAIPAIWHNR